MKELHRQIRRSIREIRIARRNLCEEPLGATIGELDWTCELLSLLEQRRALILSRSNTAPRLNRHQAVHVLDDRAIAVEEHTFLNKPRFTEGRYGCTLDR